MRLFLHATVLVLLLFALVLAVGDAVLLRYGAPQWVPMALALALFGLNYWYAPRIIEWLFQIRWDEQGREFPARQRLFLEQLCADRGLKMPRLGVIHSNTPNAFAFGHYPDDARVVVTTGLLRTLNEDEANAVLAHEMGHVEHWDFVVMTVAAMVPVMLYQLYRMAHQGRSGDGNNQARTPFLVEGAYMCYLVSQFLVLMLSRTREYFADRYSARVTRTPNALASALVKIAYRMVRAEGEFEHAGQEPWGRTGNEAGVPALMGIASLHGSRELGLAGIGGSGAAALMRWDLVNPWARLYEAGSTHPLTALRIQALNEEAEAMHQEVAYPLPEERQIRWGAFPFEVLLWAAPWMGAGSLLTLLAVRDRLWAATGFLLPPSIFPSLLLFTGVAWMCRTWLRYYGTVQPATIGKLMTDACVSQMRPRAVRLEGTILGNGVPGAFWCSDLVMRDDTGLLYVSVPFWYDVCSTGAAQQSIGRRVALEGWFRRGLHPYLEMSRLTEEGREPRRIYARHLQFGAASLLTVGGALWLAVAR